MALMDCPECDYRVSSASPSCPHCGHLLIAAPEVVSEDTETRYTAPRPPPPPVSGTQPRSQSNWVVGIAAAAVVGVILVGIAATVFLAGSISISNPFEDSDTVEAGVQTTVVATAGNDYGLVVGECIDDDELEIYFAGDDYETTPCDSPHDNEVYFVHEFAAGPYPGEDAVSDDLAGVCEGEFEAYVGRDYESSSLVIYRLWPGPELWDSGGRNGECLLYDPDLNKLTGSAYQSGS